MTKPFLKFFLLVVLSLISCRESTSREKSNTQNTNTDETNAQPVDSLTIYQTENLIIKKLSNHIYQHVSFLYTTDFGKVECNGMLVVNENQCIVFDTPTNDKSSLELINFVTDELNTTITAIVPTHFHEDCIGGIQEFEKQAVPIYSSRLTAALLKKNGHTLPDSMTTFERSLILPVGSKKVHAEYFGEGHTKDNVIGYFPESNAIFGGCLIKTYRASKGYLGDANTDKWSETVKKIKSKYPNTEIVIPGHGKSGGIELLDYTITLFEL